MKQPLKKATMIGACVTMLSGCSGHISNLIAKLDRPATQFGSDTPAAKPLGPETSRALFLLLVDGLRKEGRSRAALAYLGEYDLVYPGDRKAIRLRADCMVDVQQYAQATAIYRHLLDGDDAGAAYAGLGRVAAVTADWRAAVTNFRNASLHDTANVTYLNDWGYAQISAGSYAEAIANLRQASELDPDNQTIRDNLILGLHLAGNDTEARNIVDHITLPIDRAQAMGLLRMTEAGLRQAAASPPAVVENLTAALPSEESGR